MYSGVPIPGIFPEFQSIFPFSYTLTDEKADSREMEGIRPENNRGIA